MIHLDGNRLTLDQLARDRRRLRAGRARRRAPRARVDAARAVVDRHAAGDDAGLRHQHRLRLARRDVKIPRERARRRCSATCCAATPPASASRCRSRAVRAMMALRANVLAKGYSGIRRATLERLLDALNRRVHPRRAEPRIGRRQRRPRAARAPRARADRRRPRDGRRRRRDARRARRRSRAPGSRRCSSRPKEGLALINGTQASTAVAALALLGAERLARAADIAAALSIDGAARLVPSVRAAHPRRRGRIAGQRTSAANLLRLLAGQRHQPVARELRPRAGRLLDALRAAGARRGARRARLRPPHARRSRPTPRPTTRWCSPTTGDIVSGGNFHGAPVAMAADVIVARAWRSWRRSRERRSDRLVNPALSGLPPFLTRDSGLHSGYMMAQVTAAALVSELKTLAHPAERGHDPDLGEPRRPRQHEHGRRAQGANARSSSPRA